MFDISLGPQVTGSFIGTLFALFSAGFLWTLKSAYGKYKKELDALARFERGFAMNLRQFKDSMEFIDQWIAAVKDGRPFSFQFDPFIVNEPETYKISNIKLINCIFPLNYKLKRINLDLENLYKNYWFVIEKIDSIPNEEIRNANLIEFHKTITKTLSEMRSGYEPLKEELILAAASVRTAANVRRQSIFGYAQLLLVDVYPRYSEKRITRETELLTREIQEKKL